MAKSAQKKTDDTRSREVSGIVNSVRRIHNALDCYSRQLMQDFGITGPQLGVLRLLDRAPGMSLSELSRQIYLHASTVSGIVERLVVSGHVTRSRSPEDRRTLVLDLTKKGKKTLRETPPSGFGFMMAELEKLPLTELRKVHGSLITLSRLLRVEE
jgi:DNA-binding MarR family transcriptional regulator